MHCKGQELTGICGIVASWRHRDEHVAIVPDTMLSQKDYISPATLTATKKEDGTVGSAPESQRVEYSMLSASL